MAKPQHAYLQSRKADGIRQSADTSRQKGGVSDAERQADDLRKRLRRRHIDQRTIAEIRKLLADVKKAKGITPQQKRSVELIELVNDFADEIAKLAEYREIVGADAKAVIKAYNGYQPGVGDPTTLLLAGMTLMTGLLAWLETRRS